MRFADILGHTDLKRMLVRGADEGRVSHGLLFTGASGHGTLPLAVAYAQYLNCIDRRDGDSCGVCPSCHKYAQLAHPDLHFVFPVNSAAKSGSSKVLSDNFIKQWRELFTSTGGYFDEAEWYSRIEMDNKQGIISRAEADEIIRKLSFKSFEAKYKVMVIWLPERMRVEAANGLLKVLEEPWERTVFMMVSGDPDKLLPTILSRVQQIPVPGLGDDVIVRYLQSGSMGMSGGASVDAGKIEVVSRLACGDILRAKKFLGDDEQTQGEFFELFTGLMRLSYNDKHMELLEWGDSVAGLGRENQKRFLSYCLGMLRENYILGMGMPSITYLWGGELDFSRKFSPFIGNHNIEGLVAEVEKALAQIVQNGNPRIIFPHFALTVSKMVNRL